MEHGTITAFRLAGGRRILVNAEGGAKAREEEKLVVGEVLKDKTA